MHGAASTPPVAEEFPAVVMNGVASTPPDNRYVPPEILEKILQNLPVKSLHRFSVVSKSWKSLIQTISGREKIVTIPSRSDHLTGDTSFCRISLMSSENPIATEDSTGLFCPFEEIPRLLAFCDELWLVEAETSLFLWNPSIRSYRKLPSSDFGISGFVYGLAYDSAADDYKVLKVARETSRLARTELYSLNSNSWENFESESGCRWTKQKKLEFVNGAFHWCSRYKEAIVSFDASSKQHLMVAFPANIYGFEVEAAVLRGKLCLCENYGINGRMFVLWVMDEYGVENSWTKIMEIEHRHFAYNTLRPLWRYGNGDILFSSSRSRINANNGLFMYTNEGALLHKIILRDGDHRLQIYGGFIYVETLVSPHLPRPSLSKISSVSSFGLDPL